MIRTKRKIIIVPHFSASGGTRTYFFNCLRLFSNLNFDIVVALHKDHLDNEVKEILLKYRCRYELIQKQIHCKLIPNDKFNKLIYKIYRKSRLIFINFHVLFQLRGIVKREKPVMIFFSAWEIDVYPLLFLTHTTIYFVIHSYPQCNVSLLKKQILRFCVSRHKKFITVSAYAQKRILRYWLSESFADKVIVVPNPSNIDSVYTGASNGYSDKNKNIVLTLGHVITYKNPDFWLQVAKICSDRVRRVSVEFIWAGDGELLDKCCSSVGEYKNIKFIGFCNDVKMLYKMANIYFQPSLIESHGIAVVDALNFGLPCVVSDVGGLPETVRNGVNGYVVSVENVDLVVNALLEIMNNRLLKREFSIQSRLIFTSNYTFNIWERNMEKIFLGVK